MGSCIAVIKILGVGSLGLLTSSLAYQWWQVIPSFVGNIDSKAVSLTSQTYLSNIKNTIYNTRVLNVIIGGFSSALFGLSYIYSANSEKHPYLLYAALIAPISLATLYQYDFSNTAAIDEVVLPAEAKPQPKQKLKQTVPQDQHLSDSDDFSKSYIHVSEDDSSVISTPTNSIPNSPQLVIDDKIDEEVNQTLIRKEFLLDLNNINNSYKVGSVVSGFGFLLSFVGILGDYYML